MMEIGQPMVALLSDEADRMFDAPWQAQAFSIVVELNRSEYFDWNEWVEVFSREIARSPARVGETQSNAYYRQWLDALEHIVVERGLLAPGDTNGRAADWRAAYINTPHGQAVELAHATCPPAHTHGNMPRRAPIAVSAASSQAS